MNQLSLLQISASRVWLTACWANKPGSVTLPRPLGHLVVFFVFVFPCENTGEVLGVLVGSVG